MTVLLLEPIGESFSEKRINLTNEVLKVGRKISAKNPPEPYNGIFESKVLSRAHAEIWNDKGRILIKDVGSSNGTFINGKRISEEGQQSASFELHTGDVLEFGIDIKNEEGDDILYRKVSAKVKIISDDSSQNYSEALMNFETIVDKQIEKAENTQAELELLKNIILDITSKIESIPPTVSKKKILMELDEAHNQERLWIDKYTNLLQSSKQFEKDLEILKIDNQNLADDNEYTKCQLELSEERVKELEDKQDFFVKENQIVKDEYAKMRNDFKTLNDKLDKEEKQNEKYKRRINELEENYSKTKYENIDDINIAHDQVNELNKTITELKEKIEFLEMEKKDIIVSKNDIRDELNYQKNEFKKKIDNWKEKEKSWIEDMNKLKSEMDDKNSQNDQLSKEIQILKDENNKKIQSNSNSLNEKENKTSNSNQQKLKEENEKLKKTIEEEKQTNRANLKEWNSHKNKLMKENENLIKENKTLQQQLKELEEWKLNKEKEEENSKSKSESTTTLESSSPMKSIPLSPSDGTLVFPLTQDSSSNNDLIDTNTNTNNNNSNSNCNTINNKNKNKNNKKNSMNSTKSEEESNKIEEEKEENKEKDNNNNNNNKNKKEDNSSLPDYLAASSKSSLATIDNLNNDIDIENNEKLIEEENPIIELTKTVVIPLITGILFSVLFNYFFINK
jgi:pSer/pThr/pTyr-binding forkhead associated (FHA) protein